MSLMFDKVDVEEIRKRQAEIDNLKKHLAVEHDHKNKVTHLSPLLIHQIKHYSKNTRLIASTGCRGQEEPEEGGHHPGGGHRGVRMPEAQC